MGIVGLGGRNKTVEKLRPTVSKTNVCRSAWKSSLQLYLRLVSVRPRENS